MSTQFDATELGLLEKNEFKVITKDFAERNIDGSYTNIKKINDGLLYLTIENAEDSALHQHTTLRGLLKLL